MTIAIYPALPKPSIVYPSTQEFKTLTSNFDSGAEKRRRLIRFAKRTFELGYKYIIQADRDILSKFFRERYGSYESFWLVDWIQREWIDEFVGQGYIEALIGAKLWNGAYTNYLTEASNATGNDVPLLDATPVEDDAFYFGFTSPFTGFIGDTIRINIGTAGVGVWVITYEYWNGAWTALAGVVDGTVGFTVAGTNDVDFTQPSDWVASTIDTVSAYWIRARISSYTSIVTQPKGTQIWQAVRLYDLHSKTTLADTDNVYVDGVAKTGGGVDYTLVSGGGGGASDRILFVDPPATGSLLTSDFTGLLRIKGKFEEDIFPEDYYPGLGGVSLYNIKLLIKEVQW